MYERKIPSTFSPLPTRFLLGYGFVIVLMGIGWCGGGKRLMWLAQENSPAFVAIHATGHAIMLYILVTRVMPSKGAREST
jgi:hypothetical protein